MKQNSSKVIVMAAMSLILSCGANAAAKTQITQIDVQSKAMVQQESKSGDGHNAYNSLDWAGYYTGVMPCADCSGIETWLKLSEKKDKTFYQLSENYLDKGSFKSSGAAQWRENGSVIDLKGKNENRALAIGENVAFFLESDNATPLKGSRYALRKVEHFSVAGEEVLVLPDSLKTENKNKRKLVKYSALMNFDKVTPAGHRSLLGSFEINCFKKQYHMPTVKYFKQPFATGKLIYQTNKNKNPWLPLANDKLMTQVAARYCSL